MVDKKYANPELFVAQKREVGVLLVKNKKLQNTESDILFIYFYYIADHQFIDATDE